MKCTDIFCCKNDGRSLSKYANSIILLLIFPEFRFSFCGLISTFFFPSTPKLFELGDLSLQWTSSCPWIWRAPVSTSAGGSKEKSQAHFYYNCSLNGLIFFNNQPVKKKCTKLTFKNGLNSSGGSKNISSTISWKLFESVDIILSFCNEI